MALTEPNVARTDLQNINTGSPAYQPGSPSLAQGAAAGGDNRGAGGLVRPRDSSHPRMYASGRLAELSSQKSPLLRQARQSSKQRMQARGLLNSSIAAGAGEAAALQAAAPFAVEDARLSSQHQLQSEANKHNIATDARRHEMGLETLGRQQEFTAGENRLNRAHQADEAALGRGHQMSMQDIQNQFQSGQMDKAHAQQRIMQMSAQGHQLGMQQIQNLHQMGILDTQQTHQLLLQQNEHGQQLTVQEIQNAHQNGMLNTQQAHQLTMQNIQNQFTAGQLDQTQAHQLVMQSRDQQWQNTMQDARLEMEKYGIDQNVELQTTLAQMDVDIRKYGIDKQYASEIMSSIMTAVGSAATSGKIKPAALAGLVKTLWGQAVQGHQLIRETVAAGGEGAGTGASGARPSWWPDDAPWPPPQFR